DDDRNLAAVALAIGPRELPAIHAGHLHVQDDHVRPPPRDQIEGASAVERLVDLVPLVAQREDEQLADALVVLVDQLGVRWMCAAQILAIGSPSAACGKRPTG